MLLVIDVGNTNIVFAVFKEDNIVDQWRCETHGDIFIRTAFLQYIDAVIVASVVPQKDGAIKELCYREFSLFPVFVNAENAGIKISMDYPQEVGADRLVNAAAVQAMGCIPAIVIDFGTATTFDVVDEKGCYQGGVIAPGIRLSLSALEKAAAKLPSINLEKPPGVIGKNTIDAMRAGIYYGYIGLIEGIVGKINYSISVKPFVIATGGLATLFVEGTSVIDRVDHDLTLHGLNVIYKRISG